jgi:hypothetical protein
MNEKLPHDPEMSIRIPIIYEETVQAGTPFECRVKVADGVIKEILYKHNWFYRQWKLWTR